jgi:TM2 domain-containing membrane protein YozV/ribosomal protein L40E
MTQQKSVGLAVFLTFLIPGLGQLYARRTGKGVAFLVAWFFSVLLMFVIIGFFIAPVVWIWAMIDAVNSVSKYNLGVMALAGVGGHHTTVVAAGTASPASSVFTPSPVAPMPDPVGAGRETEPAVPLAIETKVATRQEQVIGDQDTATAVPDRLASPVSRSEVLRASPTCVRCGDDVLPGARFCPSCGTELADPVTEVLVEASNCPHCGTQVTPTAKFCRGCGSAISPGPTPPVSLSSTGEGTDTGPGGWRTS